MSELKAAVFACVPFLQIPSELESILDIYTQIPNRILNLDIPMRIWIARRLTITGLLIVDFCSLGFVLTDELAITNSFLQCSSPPRSESVATGNYGDGSEPTSQKPRYRRILKRADFP